MKKTIYSFVFLFSIYFLGSIPVSSQSTNSPVEQEHFCPPTEFIKSITLNWNPATGSISGMSIQCSGKNTEPMTIGTTNTSYSHTIKVSSDSDYFQSIVYHIKKHPVAGFQLIKAVSMTSIAGGVSYYGEKTQEKIVAECKIGPITGIKSNTNASGNLQKIDVICGDPDTIKGIVSTTEKSLRMDAVRALEYLNKIRGNPALYSKEIGINLSGIQPSPPLEWNEKLYQSAYKRAKDMGERNYMAHTDPDGYGPNHHAKTAGYKLPVDYLTQKTANFIESISGGEGNPEKAIKNLIADAGVHPPGHRIHLLAMKDFFKSHKNVGIGIYYKQNSRYRFYMVIHSAPEEVP